MNFAVTVGKNNAPDLPRKAREWAEELNLPCLCRKEETLEAMLSQYALDGLLLATARGPQVYSRGGRLIFHPGMSMLRLGNIRAGLDDRLLQAMRVERGLKVLDCTLGLAADAIVTSFAVGITGKVVGLEASKPVAFLVRAGLAEYKTGDSEADAALRRIEVVCADALGYLKNVAAQSFDIVYFDPMFEYSLEKSSNMRPLRPVAYDGILCEELLIAAKRAARLRVVVKTSSNSRLAHALAGRFTSGGKYSKIKYAVFEE